MPTKAALQQRRISARATSALVVVIAAALLSGCGGGSTGSSTSERAALAGTARDAAPQPGAGGKSVGAGGSSSGSSVGAGGSSGMVDAATATPAPQGRVAPGGRDVIYRGGLSVRVPDVTAAVRRVENLTSAVDGIVSDEATDTVPSAPRRGSAHLTLRVPTADFRQVMTAVSALGERVSQTQKAEDVTGQVVDTESRLATQKRSVVRVRALLGEATTLGEVVQVESELSRREADLEALEAQLAQLRDVTDLATIDVDLIGPAAPAVHKKKKDHTLGFVPGLSNGLAALLAVVLVALTVLGAVLPFAAAVALFVVPAWLLVRSYLRRRPSTSS